MLGRTGLLRGCGRGDGSGDDGDGAAAATGATMDCAAAIGIDKTAHWLSVPEADDAGVGIGRWETTFMRDVSTTTMVLGAAPVPPDTVREMLLVIMAKAIKIYNMILHLSSLAYGVKLGRSVRYEYCEDCRIFHVPKIMGQRSYLRVY